ncbi:MAG TPA: flagellar basal body-associated protein FliL [Paucimonas sp.]|nr:flagellar basal body-associated protein FliL [Paucimonas sp.]
MATSAKQAAKNPNLQAVPEAEGAGAEAPKKNSKKKLVLFLLLLIFFLAGGGAAWYFLGQEAEPLAKGAKPVPKVDPGKPPVFIDMEPFTVNLQSEGGEQFLQVSFTLQVADENQLEVLKLYKPQVRSRLLLLLSSRKASEISTAEGKQKLADDIVAQVKQPYAPGMPPLAVTGVFFTSFVIQ